MPGAYQQESFEVDSAPNNTLMELEGINLAPPITGFV